jgi:hypothetical protein
MKKVVVFTGKLCKDIFDEFIEQTKNIEHKIASVWSDEDQTYITTLRENNFIVVVNDIEEQKHTVPQFVTIVNGMDCAKKLGFDVAMRSRFDITSTQYPIYMDLIESLYNEKITLLCGLYVNEPYIFDAIVCGKIDEMLKFYTKQPISDGRCPEFYLLESYSGKVKLSPEDISQILHFSFDICIQNNIEFEWYRLPWWIQWWGLPYSNSKLKIVNEYCKGQYVWVSPSNVTKVYSK